MVKESCSLGASEDYLPLKRRQNQRRNEGEQAQQEGSQKSL
jgi:hypothetical protein